MRYVKLLFSRWTQVAALLLIGGALAWAIKLSVIVATDGRIIDTGAAALCMKIGLLLLFVGSTGIGNRLSLKYSPVLRMLAAVLSPVVVFGLFILLGMLLNPVLSPLIRNSGLWYAQQEAPIALAVVVYLLLGCLLYRSHTSARAV